MSGLMKDDDFLRGLPACPDIEVCWIRLVHSRSKLIHRLERVGTHLEYMIPLPLSMEPVLNESYWNNKYNSVFKKEILAHHNRDEHGRLLINKTRQAQKSSNV